MFQATGGVPRLIKQVCDHALLLAYAEGATRIDSAGIQEAWADLQQLPTPWNDDEPAEVEPAHALACAPGGQVASLGSRTVFCFTRQLAELSLPQPPELSTRGEAEAYLRLPRDAEYQEKIWDHAAGVLVVTEAGGRVTDVFGQALDFGHGRVLAANRGVIVTNGHVHNAVLEAIAALGIGRF